MPDEEVEATGVAPRDPQRTHSPRHREPTMPHEDAPEARKEQSKEVQAGARVNPEGLVLTGKRYATVSTPRKDPAAGTPWTPCQARTSHKLVPRAEVEVTFMRVMCGWSRTSGSAYLLSTPQLPTGLEARIRRSSTSLSMRTHILLLSSVQSLKSEV